MRMRTSAMLLVAGVLATPGYAADLTKIERQIQVEPKYETNSPRYCLLVFGPNAEKRVWLVLDGKQLHVDRNGNGILGEPGERIASSGSSFTVDQIVNPGRSGVSNKLRLYAYSYSDGIRMSFSGERRQFVGRGTKPKFSRSAATAPIINFDGPLTLERYAEKVTLRPNPTSKSYRKTSLRLMIGTPGLGAGTFAAVHCRCRKNRGGLVATIRYPSVFSNVKPLVEDVSLKTYG